MKFYESVVNCGTALKNIQIYNDPSLPVQSSYELHNLIFCRSHRPMDTAQMIATANGRAERRLLSVSTRHFPESQASKPQLKY